MSTHPSIALPPVYRYRYAGYDTTYQYYGMSDDGFFNGMAPCEVGTDCSDCGVKVCAACVCVRARLVVVVVDAPVFCEVLTIVTAVSVNDRVGGE